MEQIRIGCVVMAAGNSARFGTNKLLADFRGRPLIRCALDAVPEDACAVAVVTQYPEIAALARIRGFQPVRNEHPEWGASHSVALGTEALQAQCDAIAFLVADQPLLRRETVKLLFAAFRAAPDKITVAAAAGHRGNPCLFPAALFPALKRLSGDRGGSAIIRAHPELVNPVAVPECELYDVDTAAELEALS